MASDDILPPRISLELFDRRRSDFVFFGLTELSGCRPVSVAARNLPTHNGGSDIQPALLLQILYIIKVLSTLHMHKFNFPST